MEKPTAYKTRVWDYTSFECFPNPEKHMWLTHGPKAVWTFSTGRCGTMFLSYVLRMSDKMISLHEPIPRMWELSGEGWRQGASPSEDIKNSIKIARDDIVTISNTLGRHYSETNHRNSYLAYAINTLYPDSKYIFVKRNARDVVESFSKKELYRVSPFSRSRPDFGLGYMWGCMSQQEKSLVNWYETNKFILDFLSTIGKSRWFYLDFDKHIVGRDYHRFGELFEWLNLSPPAYDELAKLLGRKANASRDTTIEMEDLDFGARDMEITNMLERLLE